VGRKDNEVVQELLLKAWPKMTATHCPDLHNTRGESGKHPSAIKLAPYMWPYINLEDLSKPKALLMLLNSRGRNRPLSFARADFAATHLGRRAGILLPIFLNCYTVLMFDSSSPNRYWKVVSWVQNVEACGWAMNKQGFMTGEALLIFQIQARIYDFLANCCKSILHEIQDSADESIVVQSEPSALFAQ
jgi:hypothetical protein